jgi:hypothetical protein
LELRDEILKEHSRKQALKIAGWIGNDRKRFSRLLFLFLNDEYRVVQRSAYALSMVTDKYPELAKENIDLLLDRLDDTDTHIAVKRNIVRMLQYVDIPKRHHARVLNYCIQYVSDPKEAVAVKCFGITVLGRLAKWYPELKGEIETVIKSAMKHPTAGMKVRARKTLKDLEKIVTVYDGQTIH